MELTEKIKSELTYSIHDTIYWSDSVTVLRYIKNNSRRFHRFVDNKVSFIINFSDPNKWMYVPAKMNPADIISRGIAVEGLINSSLWNHGPKFLRDEDFSSSKF